MLFCAAFAAAGGIFFSQPLNAGAQDLERAREAASTIHREGAFPSDLPRRELAGNQIETPKALESFLERVLGGLGEAAKVSAPVAKWAFILLASVLVALFVLSLIRLKPNSTAKTKKSQPKASQAKVEDPREALQSEVSEQGLAALLAAGHYAQAIGYILRLMFFELGYDRGAEQRSLTPREVTRIAESQELHAAVSIAEQVQYAGQTASKQHTDELLSIRANLYPSRVRSQQKAPSDG